MFRKLNAKVLIIVLVVLAGIVILLNLSDDGSGDRTFKRDIVTIDSAAITAIYIKGKAKDAKELKLFREGGSWKISQEGRGAKPADTSYIGSMITELLRMRSKRLVAKDPAKWAEYKVEDSTGTLLRVEEGGNTTLDMIIGKFDFDNQTRQATSYLRVRGDDFVYAVDGFLDMSFNRDFNSFRNKKMLQSDYNGYTSLSFNYPDSGFVLTKGEGNTWMIDGQKVDSVKAENYCRSIANLIGNDFVDDIDVSTISPAFSLEIQSSIDGAITLKAFPVSGDHQFAITSSMNPDGIFSGAKGGIKDKIFKGRSHFMLDAGE